MARIVYSCCGEGQGHSSRTLTMVRALRSLGHTVLVLAARKAFEVLHPKMESVEEIPGLFIIYKNNRVQTLPTLHGNWSILKDKKTIVANLVKRLTDFKPDMAIVDFEPFLPLAAKEMNLPWISLDHQHVIPHMDPAVPLNKWGEHFSCNWIVRQTHQGEHANLVTSFYHPEEPHPNHVHFLPPILREEVLRLKPENTGHVVVYQTSTSFTRLPELLKTLPFRFHIYAFERTGTEDNLTFFPRKNEGFIEDVAKADWVFTNGGYTLMSEALFLNKPVFSVPVTGQFEQWINAYYLEKMGFGLMCTRPADVPARLNQFVEKLPEYRRNLQGRDFFGNQRAINCINRYVERFTIRQQNTSRLAAESLNA